MHYNYLLTSVDVPPISKPIIGCFKSLSYEVKAYPTTPPAGPLKIALQPVKLEYDVNPPSLCMNKTLMSPLNDSKTF